MRISLTVNRRNCTRWRISTIRSQARRVCAILAPSLVQPTQRVLLTLKLKLIAWSQGAARGCKVVFEIVPGRHEFCVSFPENSGRDDERQNDPGSNRASGNRSRTNCIHLTKASEMTLMLIKITSMQCGNKTRVTVHFAADKRLCDSPPRVDMK